MVVAVVVAAAVLLLKRIKDQSTQFICPASIGKKRELRSGLSTWIIGRNELMRRLEVNWLEIGSLMEHDRFTRIWRPTWHKAFGCFTAQFIDPGTGSHYASRSNFEFDVVKSLDNEQSCLQHQPLHAAFIVFGVTILSVVVFFSRFMLLLFGSWSLFRFYLTAANLLVLLLRLLVPPRTFRWKDGALLESFWKCAYYWIRTCWCVFN